MSTDYRHSFALELRKALKARNTTGHALAKSIGMSRRQVWFWMDGRSLPLLEAAQKASEALEWPSLALLVKSARTVSCLGCGRRITTENAQVKRRYCDETCRKVARALGRVRPATPQLDLLRTSVDAMCRSCEPLGLCGDGACPLRPVSPLPLRAGLVVAPLAVDGRKSRWDDPTARAKASEAMKAMWASRPDSMRRVNTIAANKKRWANYTPEERAGIGAKISAARSRKIA